MAAIRNGLYLAANIGCTKIEVQSDCVPAVEFISLGDDYLGTDIGFVTECSMLKKNLTHPTPHLLSPPTETVPSPHPALLLPAAALFPLGSGRNSHPPPFGSSPADPSPFLLGFVWPRRTSRPPRRKTTTAAPVAATSPLSLSAANGARRGRASPPSGGSCECPRPVTPAQSRPGTPARPRQAPLASASCKRPADASQHRRADLTTGQHNIGAHGFFQAARAAEDVVPSSGRRQYDDKSSHNVPPMDSSRRPPTNPNRLIHPPPAVRCLAVQCDFMMILVLVWSSKLICQGRRVSTPTTHALMAELI